MKNEKTSKRIAAIAGRVLNGIAEWQKMWLEFDPNAKQGKDSYKVFTFATKHHITVADLKALAASALTQSPDRKKGK